MKITKFLGICVVLLAGGLLSPRAEAKLWDDAGRLLPEWLEKMGREAGRELARECAASASGINETWLCKDLPEILGWEPQFQILNPDDYSSDVIQCGDIKMSRDELAKTMSNCTEHVYSPKALTPKQELELHNLDSVLMDYTLRKHAVDFQEKPTTSLPDEAQQLLESMRFEDIMDGMGFSPDETQQLLESMGHLEDKSMPPIDGMKFFHSIPKKDLVIPHPNEASLMFPLWVPPHLEIEISEPTGVPISEFVISSQKAGWVKESHNPERKISEPAVSDGQKAPPVK